MAVNLPVQNYYVRNVGPDPWVRPADWPVITNQPNEVQFLIADLGDGTCAITTTFIRTTTEDLVIDWGDGTTNTITTTTYTTTSHAYAIGTGTPCSRGYTTFKIRVYLTGGVSGQINICQIAPIYLSGNTTSNEGCYILEAYYGNGASSTSTSAPSFFSVTGVSASPGQYTYLEYVKLPDTVSWTTMSNMFNGCNALAKVDMPSAAGSITSYASTFQNCYNLLEVTFPVNSIYVTNFSQTFNGCTNLMYAKLPTSLNSVTTFASIFVNCPNLRNVTFPSINSATSFVSSFSGCYNLEWVKFSSLPTVTGTVDWTSAFSTCFNLQTVYFPATGSGVYTLTNAFQNCSSLKRITLPSNINVGTFASTFNACTSLVYCALPTNVTTNTLTTTFSACSSLTTVILPTTMGNNVNATGAFQNCYKLENITISNSIVFATMSTMFTACYSLKTVNWTPGAQNSLTSLSSTFSSCVNLTSINMPTSMTGLSNLQGTFGSCRSLKSVVFPSTMNTVTTANGAFSGCDELLSVTLPTSMSSCVDFASMFANCRKITSITMPNVVSPNVTTFANTFGNCISLKTAVLPGSAQLSLVNTIGNIFQACQNLTTITNFDKLGSLGATPLMNAQSMVYNRFVNISFVAPLSVLVLSGQAAINRTDVQSVRLLNTSAGQWTGASPQIDVAYTNMSTANLIQLFNDLAAQGNVTSKTINITGTPGASGLTTTDRQIITTKGWTITG